MTLRDQLHDAGVPLPEPSTSDDLFINGTATCPVGTPDWCAKVIAEIERLRVFEAMALAPLTVALDFTPEQIAKFNEMADRHGYGGFIRVPNSAVIELIDPIDAWSARS